MTRTVVSKVAGADCRHEFDQEKSKDGEPIPTSVVTLAVLPDDGERIALAVATRERSRSRCATRSTSNRPRPRASGWPA